MRWTVLFLACLFMAPVISPAAAAPEFLPQKAITLGHAPGLKVTPLSPQVRRFHLVFSKGDDIRGGLTDFARKNHITNADFTAIGAMDHALIGQSDHPRGVFRIDRLDEEMEIASMTGNIRQDAKGEPAVHIHCVVALLRNGKVYAGHLLEGRVSLTLQLNLIDSRPLP